VNIAEQHIGKMLVNMVPACSNVIEVKAGEDRPVRGTASIRSVPVNDKTSWTGPKGGFTWAIQLDIVIQRTVTMSGRRYISASLKRG